LTFDPGRTFTVGAMNAMTITDAAAATGFTASALRFYETAGLVAPDRTSTGYRTYTDQDLATLRFIGRAKRLGLSLEEIAELVPLLDADRCAPVQDQLRVFVADKIADTQRRTSELVAFLGQLQQMAAWLDAPPVDGACDDRCACTSDPTTVADDGWVGATLLPTGGADEPIVCTLAPDSMDERIAAWQAVTATALAREAIASGVRLRLPRDTDLTALARLVADEQSCCTFFTFSLTVTGDAVFLDTLAPDEARPLVHAVVGAPA
jgi:DNA-binding transcriptional MerR regulator